MKYAMQKWISVITIPCLLAAVLTGCGSKAVTEVTQLPLSSQQGIPNGAIEAPQPADIPEEDVQTLIQAGLDVAAEESDLWEISEITDIEVIMQLMQGQSGRREHQEGENFVGERTEMPDGENRERPDGTMPQLDGRNQEEGTFQEGDIPKNGQNRGEADGRQHGNRGGGMPALAIVIANEKGTAVAADDVLAEIAAAAETLGYSTMNMEIKEEQAALLEISEGYTGNGIVLISVQMPQMDTVKETQSYQQQMK